MSAREVAVEVPGDRVGWGPGPASEPVGAESVPAADGGPDERWPDPSTIEMCHSALAAMHGSRVTGLGVTSCVRGEGRTTVASALASVESQRYGRRTLLVDLDLERPSLAAAFGLRDVAGVADVLRGRVDMRSAVHSTRRGVDVLTAGHTGEDPGALVGTLDISQVARLLDGLCMDFDCVVVDLPPLSATAGIDLARACATPVLVVRAGALPAADIKRSVRALGVSPPVILNRVGGTSRRRRRSSPS